MNLSDLKIFDNKILVRYFEEVHIGGDSPCHFALNILENEYNRRNIYHSPEHHLIPMLESMGEVEPENQEELELQFVGFFFALFHDIRDDITASREVLNALITRTTDNQLNRLFSMVHDAILASRYDFETIEELPVHCKYCIRQDVKNLGTTSPKEIAEQELRIFKEYQKYDYAEYVSHRLNIIERIYSICKLSKEAGILRMDYIKSWKPKIGVFAGSFNPFHVGHLDVLQQAEKQFDKVIIASGINGEKDTAGIAKGSVLKKRLKHHQVEGYPGLLIDYLSSKPYNVTLIRGLRNGQDLQYEMNLKYALQDTSTNVDIVYFICKQNISHVSSTLCRDMAKYRTEQYLNYTNLGDYDVRY
jgi:pantetheine-phosphate adenylyltransferase